MLITADGGGSNGHRPWLWKLEIARLAAATGLDITICHYPPGTSKWNKVDHAVTLGAALASTGTAGRQPVRDQDHARPTSAA